MENFPYILRLPSTNGSLSDIIGAYSQNGRKYELVSDMSKLAGILAFDSQNQ